MLESNLLAVPFTEGIFSSFPRVRERGAGHVSGGGAGTHAFLAVGGFACLVGEHDGRRGERRAATVVVGHTLL
jgi:hypothetical protein